MERPSGVDLWSVDAVQREIYQRAALDPDEPANMIALAMGLGLTVEVLRPAPFAGDGALARVYEQWRIYIRGGISRQRKRFACAHEIAEWALREVIDEQIEDACNAVAAALIAPRRAFTRTANDVGATCFEQLALPFDLSQTAAALRAGEVLGVELALTRPGLVRTRGERVQWPAAEIIARWARGTPPAGIRKVLLTDDARRTVLLVEDLEDAI